MARKLGLVAGGENEFPPRGAVPAHVLVSITCIIIVTIVIIVIVIITALAQIPISTFSHIWVFVRQYGIVFVIIVIIIIIIIIHRKVKVSTLKHV